MQGKEGCIVAKTLNSNKIIHKKIENEKTDFGIPDSKIFATTARRKPRQLVFGY